MRIKANRLSKCQLFNRVVKKDNEGNTYSEYTEPQAINMVVWSAGGQVQAEQYGKLLNYVKNAKVDGAYTIENKDGVLFYKFNGFSLCESDGVGLYSTNKPDYEIVAIKPYKNLYLELKKL